MHSALFTRRSFPLLGLLMWGCSTWAAAAEPMPPEPVAIRRILRGAKEIIANEQNPLTLFQVSTLDALLSGRYEASYSVGQLRQRGDFGLGTYEGLDGEMIVVDGHFYHMHADGTMTESADSEKAPFAAVVPFQPDVQFSVRQASMSQLSDLIDSMLPSKNLYYAVRIHGTFGALSTRAIPKQFLPYAPLSQLTPTQNVFNYSSIVGTAVDIRSPAFVSGINQTGHHYHFVSDDARSGGHALSFTTGEVTVEVQIIRQHTIWLPTDEPFLNTTLPYVSTTP